MKKKVAAAAAAGADDDDDDDDQVVSESWQSPLTAGVPDTRGGRGAGATTTTTTRAGNDVRPWGQRAPVLRMHLGAEGAATAGDKDKDKDKDEDQGSQEDKLPRWLLAAADRAAAAATPAHALRNISMGRSLAVSPDGRGLVAFGCMRDDEGCVWLWDPQPLPPSVPLRERCGQANYDAGDGEEQDITPGSPGDVGRPGGSIDAFRALLRGKGKKDQDGKDEKEEDGDDHLPPDFGKCDSLAFCDEPTPTGRVLRVPGVRSSRGVAFVSGSWTPPVSGEDAGAQEEGLEPIWLVSTDNYRHRMCLVRCDIPPASDASWANARGSVARGYGGPNNSDDPGQWYYPQCALAYPDPVTGEALFVGADGPNGRYQVVSVETGDVRLVLNCPEASNWADHLWLVPPGATGSNSPAVMGSASGVVQAWDAATGQHLGGRTPRQTRPAAILNARCATAAAAAGGFDGADAAAKKATKVVAKHEKKGWPDAQDNGDDAIGSTPAWVSSTLCFDADGYRISRGGKAAIVHYPGTDEVVANFTIEFTKEDGTTETKTPALVAIDDANCRVICSFGGDEGIFMWSGPTLVKSAGKR